VNSHFTSWSLRCLKFWNKLYSTKRLVWLLIIKTFDRKVKLISIDVCDITLERSLQKLQLFLWEFFCDLIYAPCWFQFALIAFFLSLCTLTSLWIQAWDFVLIPSHNIFPYMKLWNTPWVYILLQFFKNL